MIIILLIWACLATVWATALTLLFFNNPLPFPDRGHRVFGVKDEQTRAFVVKLLETLSGKKARFTFDSGKIHQTILHDNLTSIHYIDEKPEDVPASAISFAVKNPLASANRAIEMLQNAGFQAKIIEGIETDLPPNYLVPVWSDAFDGWALVFRRSLIKMPKPKFRT